MADERGLVGRLVSSVAATLDQIARIASPVRIFALAFFTRILLALVAGYQHEGEFGELRRLATSLATTGQFANPYICTTGASSHSAPGFPFILSLWHRLFQPGVNRELGLILTGSAITALMYAMLPWFASRIGLRQNLGALAGVFGAAFPLYGWLESRGVWEAPWIAVFLMAMLGLFFELHESGEWSKVVLLGLVSGVSFYFAPQLLPPFAVLGVISLFAWHVKPAHVVVAGLIAAFVIAPWEVRNYREFGKLIFVRGNLGLELHVAYNDLTSATFSGVNAHIPGQPTGWTVHPCDQPAECAVVQQLGESAYYAHKMQLASAWAAQHPGRAMQLTLLHAIYFWFPPFASIFKTALSDLLALLGIIGLIRLSSPEHKRLGLILAAVMVSFSLIYALTISDSRYRYPIYPILLLLAADLIVALLSRISESSRNLLDSPGQVIATRMNNREDPLGARTEHASGGLH